MVRTYRGWKVVHRRPSDRANGYILESAYAPSYASREYRVGKWTKPAVRCGPLFIFARWNDVEAFTLVVTRDEKLKYDVYPCEWEPWRNRLPRPWGAALAGWSPDGARKEAFARYLYAVDMPRGTRLAHRVRLLKPLAKT